MAKPSDDPLLRRARREAWFVVITWAAALLYTIIYCARYGYGRSVDDLKFVWGFPDWVFWGIIVPWAVCIVISIWFAHAFVTDEDLGEDRNGGDDE